MLAQCYWQRVTDYHKGWRRAEAARMWYQVREDIEAALNIVHGTKGKTGPSCARGYHFEVGERGRPCLLREYIDQEHVPDGARIVVRIMPKCVTVPPRMRSAPPPPDETALTEDERLAAMQRGGQRYHVERVGQDPRDRKDKANYVCKNCSCAGHYRKNCPWLKIEDGSDKHKR